MKNDNAWSPQRMMAVAKRDYARGDIWSVVKTESMTLGVGRIALTKIQRAKPGTVISSSNVVVWAKELPRQQICASWLGRRIRRGKAVPR